MKLLTDDKYKLGEYLKVQIDASDNYSAQGLFQVEEVAAGKYQEACIRVFCKGTNHLEPDEETLTYFDLYDGFLKWDSTNRKMTLEPNEVATYILAETRKALVPGKIYSGKFRKRSTLGKYSDMNLWEVVESIEEMPAPGKKEYSNNRSSGQLQSAIIEDRIAHAKLAFGCEELLPYLAEILGDHKAAHLAYLEFIVH